MRRILLLALMATAALALPTGVAYGKPKPATFKAGTYKAKLTTTATKFNITLKHAKCTTAPGQGTPSLHFCVSLPVAPEVDCTGPITGGGVIGPFATPLALSGAGKTTEQTPSSENVSPNGITSTMQSVFSVTFTKKGTASGYVELNETDSAAGTGPVPCKSGKVAFTAKLG